MNGLPLDGLLALHHDRERNEYIILRKVGGVQPFVTHVAKYHTSIGWEYNWGHYFSGYEAAMADWVIRAGLKKFVMYVEEEEVS